MAKDLDQALGVDMRKPTGGDSEAQMAVDLGEVWGKGKVRRRARREKL